ncbi:hypothetical protein SCLCIDRAFT_28466 [Scleroderma citrinum Foug A]|uniref:Uncharacterized protein n=1 Tax=Scleroderma citrinum Foug A TaxID=1036808 RepID=A0A0C3DB32_9AGAM|nr:hypothetical protein SCLCIDRAFT_28466 [Scleroderma citrinum Foug A]
MSNYYTLLQMGSDPSSLHFQDSEGRQAFTVITVDQNANPVVKVAREAQWSQQHPDIMGPESAFLYLGPGGTRGYMVYGNGKELKMADHLRQTNQGSPSRYFTTLAGRELKWRLCPDRMECVDGRSIVAVWAPGESEDRSSAHLTLQHSTLSYVTELVTTLILNRMAQHLNWDA